MFFVVVEIEWTRQDDLITLAGERGSNETERLVATGRHEHIGGRHRRPVPGAELGCERFT